MGMPAVSVTVWTAFSAYLTLLHAFVASAQSGDDFNWTELTTSGVSPEGRAAHTMVALSDSATFVFGGFNDGSFGDSWHLTASGHEATWTQLTASDDAPAARATHAMVALSDSEVLLFGGRDDNGDELNDTWQATVSDGTVAWTQLAASGDAPGARYRHTMVVLSSGAVVLFGGQYGGSSVIFSDSWQVSVSGDVATWTQLNPSGDVPGSRTAHSMVALSDGTALLFGGLEQEVIASNTPWQLTVSGVVATWTPLTNSDDAPSARSRHTMAALPDSAALLFGGTTGTSKLSDWWQVTVSGGLATWTQLTLSSDVPQGRDESTMVALSDSAVLLFGGYGDDYQMLSDSWLVTTTRTSSPTPSPTPPPATPSPTALSSTLSSTTASPTASGAAFRSVDRKSVV